MINLNNLKDVTIEEDHVLGRGWLVCLYESRVTLTSCDTYDEAVAVRSLLSDLPRKLRESGMDVR